MKYLNKITVIILSGIFFLSCSIVDLSKLNISVSIDQNGILEKDTPIILSFSQDISDPLAPDKVKLQGYFSEAYHKVDTFWLEDNKIKVIPIEELEKGKRYVLTLAGSVKASSGIDFEVNLVHNFYYINTDPPLLLTNFYPSDAQTIGNFDNLNFTFSKSPGQDNFKEEFSTSPYEELVYSWSENDTKVSVSAKKGWENYINYSWSYKDYNGVFIVQQDTTPPQLLRIETGDYNEDDSTFTLIAADLNLVEYRSSLRLVFSEEVDKENLSASFSIEPDTNARLWQSSPKDWLFLPDEGWDQETEYTINLSKDLTDIAGNPLNEAFSTSFTPAISPVTIGSVKVSSNSGGSVIISDFNNIIPLEISVDEPDSSCNIIINISSGKYSNFKERNNFFSTILFEGFLPPTSAPSLINYQWTTDNSITLNYSNFIRSISNSPWGQQTYKLIISAGKNGKNDLGSYVKEEVSIVFSIAP